MDVLAIAGQMLVDRVVDEFIDEVVQATRRYRECSYRVVCGCGRHREDLGMFSSVIEFLTSGTAISRLIKPAFLRQKRSPPGESKRPSGGGNVTVYFTVFGGEKKARTVDVNCWEIMT